MCDAGAAGNKMAGRVGIDWIEMTSANGVSRWSVRWVGLIMWMCAFSQLYDFSPLTSSSQLADFSSCWTGQFPSRPGLLA
jgi:hypothetical protein